VLLLIKVPNLAKVSR